MLKEDESWNICDPMFAMINIYDSYADYLKSAEPFTLEQRYLCAIHWYFGEVMNGGHHQFFYNSTGIAWEDALKGFELFGMNKMANNLQKIVDYMGGKIPFDRAERIELLEKLEVENQEAFSAVLDEFDYVVYKDDGSESVMDYVKTNPEKFVFDDEYETYV